MANEQQHHQSVIGNAQNFWLHSSQTGFDLTHPEKPTSPPVKPSVTVQTSTSPITVDPAKSALVIIDMQNFFLSEALGRVKGAGHAAVDQLVRYAIPACRTAGTRILWVNWGLTAKEVEEMPPSVKRAFGFEAVIDTGKGHDEADMFKEKEHGFGVDKQGNPRPQGNGTVLEGGKDGRVYKGLGSHMSTIKHPKTGEEIDAGRLLLRDSWNAALYPPLDAIYEEGRKLKTRPDVWIHKNRMSAMWGSGTECEKYLEQEGIKTLFFTGVNTDQCVGGTYQDCFSKGYDCILLGDGAGTTSPEYAQQCFQFNAANTWGFLASCKQLAEGVEKMAK